MNPEERDDEPLLWCSLHSPPKCALAKRALALYRQANAGQAGIVLQARWRGRDDYHVVVCTGGEQGQDDGWLMDVVRDPWLKP